MTYQWGHVSVGKREKRPVNLKEERGAPKRGSK